MAQLFPDDADASRDPVFFCHDTNGECVADHRHTGADGECVTNHHHTGADGECVANHRPTIAYRDGRRGTQIGRAHV